MFGSASEEQFVEIGRMKGNINKGDKIYRIASKELTELAKSSYKEEHKKVHLNSHITLKKEQPIIFEVETCCDDTNSVFKDIKITLSSENIVPVEAMNKPISEERIIEQLSKTSDTMFVFDEIGIDMENNLFLPSIKILNELRRTAIQDITLIAQGRILRKSTVLSSISDITEDDKKKVSKRTVSVLLNVLDNSEKYENLKGVTQIYIPLKYFANKKYFAQLSKISTKFDTYIYLPTIIKSNYKNLLNNVVDNSVEQFPIKGFVISNLSSCILAEMLKEKYGNRFEFIGNYTLNVYNKNTVQELKKLGLTKLTISPELDSLAIKGLTKNSLLKQELIVYGRTPLMNTNYCFLGKTNKCYPTCGSHCKDSQKFYLKDRLGLYFPVIPDSIQTVSTIYNSKITSINGSDFNVSSYRIDILDENVEKINCIIETVLAGKRFEGKDFTNGNLNREI